MKIREPRGSSINFNWQDDTDIYIRGHVTPEEALRHLDDDEKIAAIRHMWARWYSTSEGPEYGMDNEAWIWHTRDTPAPGWARVTMVEVREVER